MLLKNAFFPNLHEVMQTENSDGNGGITSELMLFTSVPLIRLNKSTFLNNIVLKEIHLF